MPAQPAIQFGLPRAVFGRPKCRTVYCNANNGSESRIRFQNSRDATAQRLTKGGTESFTLFNNANLSQARRQSAQVRLGSFISLLGSNQRRGQTLSSPHLLR